MAYAAVVSLKQILEGLLDSARSRIQIPNSELKLIHDDLCYLISFFDKLNSLQDSINAEEFEKPIKDVVQTTQDLIESHISDLFHSGDESSISGFSRDLLEVKEKLGSLTKMLKAKAEDQQSAGGFAAGVAVSSRIDADRNRNRNRNKKIVGLADGAVSSRIDFGRNKKIVGLEEELIMLKQWVIFRDNSRRKVISIVGMGGIGKTTLAKEVYLDPLTIEHFDIRLFVEIDLEYQLIDVLMRLLGQVVSVESEKPMVDELGELLYKCLYGRRYLVVLDDIWDTRVWDELRRFFPDNANGSSIILTTRLADVAHNAGDEENILHMHFLSFHESWCLLRGMAFSDEEDFPLELEEIGNTIARKLRGLPLSIVMIGKLLFMSERTMENWMAVAENIDSSLGETHIPKVLNLSYTQLPQHLKACFLYLGLFPPNYNIPTAQLIKLWVAEGFIEPVTYKSLEQKAEEYLEELVSRSLVILHERNSRGRIKTCGIHSIFQNLCITEAREEKIFHIVNEGSRKEGTKNQRRLAIHSKVVLGSKQVHSLMESISAVRSLVFICPQHQHPLQVYLRFRWLRVLHALSFRFQKFPDEVLKLVGLRYLAITYDGELPSSISRLWNLEVLIIRRSQSFESVVFLPLEIWKLHKLRHLECMGCYLPDPCTAATGDGDGSGDFLFLNKLLTLSGVSAGSCTERVLERMPNLMKLGIWFDPAHQAIEVSCFDGVFTRLRRLESIKCVVMNRGLQSEAASSRIYFPSGLRKLTLIGCGFPWEHMMNIGGLPHLEVLKLRWSAFCGRTWESCEGDFFRLKFLLLEDLDVESFIADSSHFPVLEHLVIRRCYELQEIPSGIGDIPTLQIIEVDDCSVSVEESARFILEEQEEMGNDYLQVRIHSSSDDKNLNS